MDKAALISALQAELRKHEWSSFVEDPPSIAEGGKAVVTPGCAPCQRRATPRFNSWTISFQRRFHAPLNRFSKRRNLGTAL